MKNSKKLITALLSITFALILFACSENSIQDKTTDKEIKGPDYTPGLYPPDRYYTEDHVWVKLESENIAIVGITTFPLSSIGIVTSANMISEPIVGKTGIPTKKRVVELIGTLSNFDVLMPIFGDIDIMNPELELNPGLINQSPYGLGWILRITNFNILEVQNLMNANDYASYVAGL